MQHFQAVNGRFGIDYVNRVYYKRKYFLLAHQLTLELYCPCLAGLLYIPRRIRGSAIFMIHDTANHCPVDTLVPGVLFF